MKTLPRNLTVLIDSREKRPLLFPETLTWHRDRSGYNEHLFKVKKQTLTLKAGDYQIKGMENVCRVERKGSLDELYKNLLTKDYTRFIKAIETLVDGCPINYLLLDMTPSDMFRPTRHCEKPELVFDALMNVVDKYGLKLWYSGGCKAAKPRRTLGEQVLRVILAHGLRR